MTATAPDIGCFPQTEGERQECFRLNIEAIERVNARLSLQLRQIEIPAGVVWTMGRDGIPNAQIDPTPAACHWLGGCSCPSIAVKAALKGFDGAPGNWFIPTVGTGAEPIAVVERLPSFAALFVYEHDPLNLCIALRLHDYAELVNSGRLAFLCGEDIASRLSSVFETRPGYEVPTRMIWPGHFEDLPQGEVQASLQRSMVEIETRRGAHLRQLLAEWDAAVPEAESARYRIAVISGDSYSDSLSLARSAAECLGGMGHSGHFISRARPDEQNLLHIAEQIRKVDPHMVIVVGGCAWALGNGIPSRLPMAFWVGPQVSTITPPELASDARRFVFASVAAQIATDVPPSGAGRPIELIEVGAAAMHAGDTTTADAEVDCDVAVIGAMHDCTDGALGLTQASHRRLWEELCRRAGTDANFLNKHEAESRLSEVERDLGMSIRDPDLRDRLLRGIRERLVPNTRMAAAVEALLRMGLRVGVWGSGWPEDVLRRASVSGRWGDDLAKRLVLQRTHLVFATEDFHDTPWLVLHAVMAGSLPVILDEAERWAVRHPQLDSVFGKLPSIQSISKLRKAVRAFIDDPAERDRIITETRSMIESGHMLHHRLAAIIGRVMGQRPGRGGP